MLILSRPYTRHNPRLTFLRVVLGTSLGLLVLALINTQIVHGARYGSREEKQSLRRIRVPSARGEIVDRHGRILANNRPSYDIVIYLEQLQPRSKKEDIIGNVGRSLRALSTELGMPVNLSAKQVRIHYRLRRPIPLTVWRDLDTPQLAAFAERAAELPGADLLVTPVREYPQGSLAAHVLGFVGKADPKQDAELERYYYYQPDKTGRQGVERACDDYLRGAPGGRTIQVSPGGTLVGEIGRKPATRGQRVVLTIDTRIQQLLEEAMQSVSLPAGKTLRGAAVVLHARTGEVLAMTSLPTFDPNLFNPGTPAEPIRALFSDPDKPMLNRAYGGLYAPGSTFKPITLLAGLKTGKVAPADRVTCEGSLRIGNWNRPFGCWKRSGHGVMDANAAMKQSCDVWFYVEGMSTGVQAIETMARQVGLGRETGFDIGNEYEGLVPSPGWKQKQRGEDWWNGDTAQLSIGQSFLLVTPLQMAVVTAALANGGQVLQPYVVSRIENNSGETLKTTSPRVRHQVVVARSDLAITRRTMLAAVRDRDGTAHRAAVRGLAVAGKTGTAEFDLYENGKTQRINRAWFIGFAPYDNPEVALALVIEDAESGGHTAAPVAGRVLAGIFGKTAERVGARNEYAD